MEPKIARVLIGLTGLLFGVFSLWYLERDVHTFEEKVSMKIAAATLVFSVMMFTPVISLRGGFIGLGVLAFPSTKLVADSIIMAFLASSLKDLIERDMQKED